VKAREREVERERERERVIIERETRREREREGGGEGERGRGVGRERGRDLKEHSHHLPSDPPVHTHHDAASHQPANSNPPTTLTGSTFRWMMRCRGWSGGGWCRGMRRWGGAGRRFKSEGLFCLVFAALRCFDHARIKIALKPTAAPTTQSKPATPPQTNPQTRRTPAATPPRAPSRRSP